MLVLKLIFLAEHLREDWVSLRITGDWLMVNSLHCTGLDTLWKRRRMRLYCPETVHLHERHLNLEGSERYSDKYSVQ